MDTPTLAPGGCNELLDTRYIKVFELAYEDGTRYLTASRRDAEELCACKTEEQLLFELPDAVGCRLVLAPAGAVPRIVLFREYRYPCGQFVLGIPSGLIDDEDRQTPDPVISALCRELEEECGVTPTEGDSVEVICPFLFNTPGFTDESCALLAVTLRGAGVEALSHARTQGTERLADFACLTRKEALAVLAAGRDPWGHFLPMITWCALTHFVDHPS